jgi:hypothetical protein
VIDHRPMTDGSFYLKAAAFSRTAPATYGGPGTNVANASFGRIVLRQVNTPRQIQFRARVSL